MRLVVMRLSFGFRKFVLINVSKTNATFTQTRQLKMMMVVTKLEKHLPIFHFEGYFYTVKIKTFF